MARRGSRFNRGRVQRFGTVGQYDYGPSGAITEDFGDVAKEVGTAFQKRVEVAEKAKERIDKYDKEALEGLDFPYTGVADLDRATMAIAQQAKEGLFAAKQRIGTMVEDPNRPGKKKMYTIDDFSSFKNNLLNGAKIYKGTPDLVQKQLESFSENENISDISSDGLTKTLGSRLSTESAYNIEIDKNGNFVGSSLNKDGERQNYDMKKLAMNGVQQVEKFDSIKDIADFQKVYASKQKNFEIDGQTYTAEQVLGNPVLFTKHVERQAPAFESAKKQYIENFKTDDNKVISYLYDRMGVKLGSKGDEENSIILNSDTGKFEISETLRNKARDAFALELEGAFGTKTTGKAQIIPKDKPVKGKIDTDRADVVIGEMNQTFSTEGNQAITVDDKGKSTRAVHSFKDLDFSLHLTNSIGQEQVINSASATMDADTNATNSVLSTQAQQFLNDNKLTGRNSDLYAGGNIRPKFVSENASGALKIDSETNEIAIEKDISSGALGIQGFSLGLDLTEADLTELGAVGMNGNALSGITGVSFTYERYKNNDFVQDATETDIESAYPRRPVGIRFVGNTTLKRKSDTKGTFESGQQLEKGTKIVGESKEVGQMMTNMIEDQQIAAYVKVLGKNQPGIQKAFNDALKNNMTNTEAFYKAMITLKALKG
tara:strand:+ start:163 stop:2136 length:1974 start_codon:yes stop_codon:yes gene_type:complete